MLRTGIAILVALMLAGCGDPLAGVDRINDVDLSQTEGSVAAVPSDAEVSREGFFGTDAANGTEVIAAEVEAPEPVKRRGLLGLLRRDGAAASPADDAQADTGVQAVAVSQAQVAKGERGSVEPPVQIAALAPEAAPRRSRLFGRSAAKQAKPRTGPDAMDVAYGTVLANGLIARVCDAKGQSLGRRAGKAAAPGFGLYDSAPGSAGARTWYVTGFSDGCPRQLTAANVLLGSASLYEQLHFGPIGKNLPYAATDAAYEKVKRKICGARKGTPCGSKIKKMEKTTFFLSAYASFGSSKRWTEVLFHDGEVLALAVKSNG